MRQYLATFHTHLSALLSCQALQGAGHSARMMPVPRSLSSSCGTCVRYSAPDDCRGLLDGDMEAVYLEQSGGFSLVLQND